MQRDTVGDNYNNLPDDPDAVSLYIHIPFCVRRCSYCDFPTGRYEEALAERYLDALDRELSNLPELTPRTIFFGGGTPTSLTVDQLGRLFHILDYHVDRSRVREFTSEANPGTLTEEVVQALVAGGVDRVSLGAQTFRRGLSELLGRSHEVDDIGRSVDLLRAGGIENLNLDLIYAIPGQTKKAFESDLDRALALEPDHISAYGLIYEEGTEMTRRLRSGELQPVDDELEVEMYALLRRRLAEAGFEQYEISNFARGGRVCHHNLSYWSGDSYYGVGVGAHSYVGGVRFANDRAIGPYLRRIEETGRAVTFRERLSEEKRARELLILHLRTMAGVDRREFRKRTGYEIEHLVGSDLERFRKNGFLDVDGEGIRLTGQALPVSDHIFATFV